MPSEARPPCIGDASPMPDSPLSQCTLTQALRCAGLSSGDQRDLKRLDIRDLHVGTFLPALAGFGHSNDCALPASVSRTM